MPVSRNVNVRWRDVHVLLLPVAHQFCYIGAGIHWRRLRIRRHTYFAIAGGIITGQWNNMIYCNDVSLLLCMNVDLP
jgi:hypothetical protein